ncbi:MAG TPA: FtsX-like permease family protein [Gammaproteobacteria bacterium]|nr:FtsX-like permease family protein [Gammaproteobacteria bacterium]HIK68571.1 FtsX-like permease family protein [Pseudomonadales bacterium]
MTGMNSLAIEIGLRFLAAGILGKGHNRYLRFISVSSVLGMALGITALIVVVSVMNGFDRELKSRLLSVVPHLVMPVETDLEQIDEIRRALGSGHLDGIIAAELFLEMPALLVGGQDSQFLSLQGIQMPRSDKNPFLFESLVSGSWDQLTSHETSIMLGRRLADLKGLDIGDKLLLVIPDIDAVTGQLLPRALSFTLTGTFELGAEPDYLMAFANVEGLKERLGLSHASTRLLLSQPLRAKRVQLALENHLGVPLQSWTDSHGDFFNAVQMEKVLMFLLLSMIVVIASLSLVASMGIMIREKKSALALLLNLGLGRRQLMIIFLFQGFLLSLSGIFIGILLGIPLTLFLPEVMSLVEAVFDFNFLAGSYFNQVPTELRFLDMVIICVLAIAVSTGAILPQAVAAGHASTATVLC